MINLFKVYNSESKTFKKQSNITEKACLYSISKINLEPLQKLKLSNADNIIFGISRRDFNIGYHILSGRITFNSLSVSASHTEGVIKEFGCYCCRIVFKWFDFFKINKMYVLKPYIILDIKQNHYIRFKELSRQNGGLNIVNRS